MLGAVFAAVVWHVAKVIFAWYVESGFNNFGAVYGSLASIMGLMLWAYITALIVFLGAEVGASLQRTFWPNDEE